MPTTPWFAPLVLYPTVSRLGVVMGCVHLAAHIPELCAPSGGWHVLVLCRDNPPGTWIPGAPRAGMGLGAACSMFVLCVLLMASSLHPQHPLPSPPITLGVSFGCCFSVSLLHRHRRLPLSAFFYYYLFLYLCIYFKHPMSSL